MKFHWDKSFDKFLNSLDLTDKFKLIALIKSIEEVGTERAQRVQWIKKLDKNLYEIRAKSNQVFLRGIYFHIENNHYFITNGFKKKTNKTPKKEIDKAKNIRQKRLGS